MSLKKMEPYKPIKTQEPIQLSKIPDAQKDSNYVAPIERDDWPAPPDPAAAYPDLCKCSHFVLFFSFWLNKTAYARTSPGRGAGILIIYFECQFRASVQRGWNNWYRSPLLGYYGAGILIITYCDCMVWRWQFNYR